MIPSTFKYVRVCAAGSLLLAFVLFAATACGDSASSVTETCEAVTAQNADACIRLNQIQVLGTHNSYHVAPEEAIVEALRTYDPEWGENLEYTHRPLTEQLDELGIRQFELDVFADPDGGHFARPVGRQLAGREADLEEEALHRPGYKVLHVQDVDYRTTCRLLVDCLEEIRAWSVAHPMHLPIMVLIEVKDRPLPDTLGVAVTEPIPVGRKELDALDAEIRSVFDAERLITPDDVRGDAATLEDAILDRGWPVLAAARGRVLFALDNTGVHRERYLDGHPSLEGRVMFVSTPPGSPSAAFIKMNDPLGENEALIRERVAAGYLIRTRADVPTRQARSGDTTQREAALRSGAQYVSTDYPEPSPFGSGYVVTLPGAEGAPARCNPIHHAAACDPAWLVR